MVMTFNPRISNNRTALKNWARCIALILVCAGLAIMADRANAQNVGNCEVEATGALLEKFDGDSAQYTVLRGGEELEPFVGMAL